MNTKKPFYLQTASSSSGSKTAGMKMIYRIIRYPELTFEVERLARFLRSPLAGRLWRGSPKKIASSIDHIWNSLGNVMGQRLHEKTIYFAMKCLGIDDVGRDILCLR